MSKEIVREAIVGGLSGLAVVAGYIVLRSHLDNAGAGDWLQFAGAVFGSASAVVGALWIESWKRKRDSEQGKATLLDVLKQMDESFKDIAMPIPDDVNRAVNEINTRRFFLETTKGYAEFVLKQHLIPNSKVWRHTNGLINFIDRILAVTWYDHDEHAQDDLCNDASVARWHKSVEKIAGYGKRAVKLVIDRQSDERKKARNKAAEPDVQNDG